MCARPVNADYVTECRQLQAALKLAARGFRVYPCRPGSKLPAGKWLEGATTDPLTIVELWLQNPGANVLVVCGARSGLSVLDFDVKGGAPGEALVAELLGEGWKSRYCYTTTPSGGYHIWCAYEESWGNQKHVSGLDCQGEGSYVVVPPSVVEGRPYLLVNPHLPLISTLDPEAHARVSARLGTRIRPVPSENINLPEGWETVECPEWAEIWPKIGERVQWFLHTGDPDVRPPGDPSARGFDTRSGAVMGAATNLLALKEQAGTGWLLRDAQVLQLLSRVEHVMQYAYEHAGGTERAPWWLWRYNVVPARDNVRRPMFDGLVDESTSSGPSPTAAALENPGGSVTGAAVVEVDPEPSAAGDPLQEILAYVSQLEAPYDQGIREACYQTAQHGLDELARDRIVDALHQQTDVTRGVIKKQLAGEVRAAVKERRDLEKRTPGGLVSRYVYVEDAGALWRLNPPGWVTVASFRAMHGLEAAQNALEPSSGLMKVERSTYRPGRQWAPGFDRGKDRWAWQDDSQKYELNTWEPSPLVPTWNVTDEDVRPWLRHLDEVLRVPAGDREHLLDWLACTVQFPGVKVNHMLLLGGGQGVGKDTLLQPVIAAVGKVNALVIGGSDAVSGFDTEKLAHCSFMLLQELSTGDLAEARRAYNQLKTYAAAPPDELCINIKGIRQFFVPNLVKVAAVTNDRRALRLEQDDRRSFMVWCEGTKASIGATYFRDLWRWYKAGGGLEAVTGWLLLRDLSHFDPMGSPPATSWRSQALEDSLPDVAQVVRDLIVEGEGPAGDDIVTAADLLPLVRARMAGAKNPPSERGVGYALTELGYRSRRVNEPSESARAAKRLSRRKATFYMLKNEKRWIAETEAHFWDTRETRPQKNC